MATATATADEVLDIARKELGYKESPPESNLTKYGKWYGLNGNPWCMMFIMWVFAQAGASELLPTRTASCGEFMRAAKKQGKWRTKNFQAGDIVIFDFPGNNVKTDHVGLVESAVDNAVYTIEGNTSTGNDANGGSVMRRRRNLSVVLGGFRPKYGTRSRWNLPRIGDLVNFIGGKQFTDCGETASATPAAACLARIETVNPNSSHPIYVLGGNVEGWVDLADVQSVTSQDIADSGTAQSGSVDAVIGSVPSASGGAAGASTTELGFTEASSPEDRSGAAVQFRKVRVSVKTFLSVRTGPGVENKELYTLRSGAVVSVGLERCGWGQLPNGGWISLQYVEDVDGVEV